MYSISLAVEDRIEYETLAQWITEEFKEDCVIVETELNHLHVHIAVVEVSKWLDWVKIHRFRKKNKECRIIPLLDPTLLYTSPLAVEFKLNHLLVKSVKKHIFLRTIKRAIQELTNVSDRLMEEDELFKQIHHEQPTDRNTQPFQEAFLRRLMSGDVTTEEELIESRSFLPGKAVPNVVCFIQGFVNNPTRREKEGWHASSIIQDFLRKRFQGHQLSFLPYRKHLIMLIQVPNEYVSLRYWKAGEDKMLDTIQALEKEYGIYLYIGVGSIYREPLLLHHSYKEACKARRTSPYDRISLRYFEEITTDVQIKKCTDYIARYCTEDLSIKRVADQINLSVPYFSRIFKQETGRNFVEYVTFVRMQRAVWLLRHTNHTIEWIAEELGFNTPNYFSGTFKKYVGLSPREYRATEEIVFV
ncbi:helix-turn-helix domain-containing protein [Bacillus sp. 31A1R]|uniref:Helix-turn-helix domain-containing protein n=1 Tax=Robertmurraya mangrovi TaxID=3098077 RepID=A0ABU5J2T5_9BACI|nr:helix-turn-helix domain-containing protein [Bacillus sp. 31A1R]MDZ5473656.1 helix-turn-helix domain-containing protein [Bacillus sp. 31A1R]